MHHALTVDWCEGEVNCIYSELEILLQENNDLELYLPKSVLGVSICLYRYHCGNYLGTKNFIWKIPNNRNNRSETKNAQALLAIPQ